MRFLVVILILLITSCNPFISKELRRKNKCNRKLERVTKKCPELLNKDTLVVNIDTTIVTNEVRVDTLVSTKHDTIEIVKDKFRVRIVNLIDTFLIEGGCDSDTVVLTRTVKVPYEVVKPVKLEWYEHLYNFLKPYWWIFIIILLLYLVYKKVF